MSLSSAWKELFFPFHCLSCGRKTPRGEAPLCPSCRALYERVKTAPCPRCRRPNARCACPPAGRPVDLFVCLSVFPYERSSPGGKLILALKDRAFAPAADLLARDMIDSLRNGCILRDDALIVYVPRGRRALSRRGVDQAAELAKRVSALSGLPLVSALRRTGALGAQKNMTVEERFAHAGKCFRAAPGCPDLQGRQVVLIDDIVTSGATASACAAVLRARGAGQIVGLFAGKTAKRKKISP